MALPPALTPNEIVEVTIGDFDYKIEKLGGKVGRKLIARLARAVAPAFAGLAVDEPDVGAVISNLVTGLKDEDLDYVCDTLAKQTRFSPAGDASREWQLAVEFDKHFSGHYGRMALWIKASLEANYGDFFAELGLDPSQLSGLLSAAMAKSPAAPTGPSGAASLRASAA